MEREYSGIRENEWDLGKFTFHMVKQRDMRRRKKQRDRQALLF